MSNKNKLLIAATMVLLFMVSDIYAQGSGPPHDTSKGIDCLTYCHSLDASGTSLLPVNRGATQELLCRGCHNPQGQAAGKDKVANHVVGDGAVIIECSACHNPHVSETSTDAHADGRMNTNLFLIRNEVRNATGVMMPAVFQNRPGHFAFSTAPFNGICQTCHAETNYHTNNGTGDQTHEAGNDCITCHLHETGFIAQE